MQITKKKVEGSVYCGQFLQFRKCEERIGKGGNGEVYLIKVLKGQDLIMKNWPDFHNGEFVVKLFSVESKNHRIQRKRYKRFCQEVKKQLELSQLIEGVMPIIDYYLPKEYTERNKAWYVMPKAESIKYIYRKSLEEKLELLKNLLDIVDHIHKQGVAHRDIKPENLLMLNGLLYLSDFGLLWTKESEHVTDEGERLGPIKILPPEMESITNITGFNYYESDIYLYAKVAWMILKGHNIGFYGQYSRGDSQIYLDKKDFNCSTLEPIHCLIEGATEAQWKKRISIDECRELLIEQLYVCREELPEDKENWYKQQEEMQHFTATVVPDEKVYSEPAKIHKCLDNVVKGRIIYIHTGNEKYLLCPTMIKKEGNDFLFIESTAWGKMKRYLVAVDKIVVLDEKGIIYTKKSVVEQNGFVRLSTLDPLRYPLEMRIIIDGDFEIEFES